MDPKEREREKGVKWKGPTGLMIGFVNANPDNLSKGSVCRALMAPCNDKTVIEN